MWKNYHATRIAFVCLMVAAFSLGISPRGMLSSLSQQGELFSTAMAVDGVNGHGGDYGEDGGHDDGDYDHDGYDHEGRDRHGYDRNGYDQEGYSHKGRHRDGHYDKSHDHRPRQGPTGDAPEQTFNPQPTVQQY